jgi:hypothetical protein
VFLVLVIILTLRLLRNLGFFAVGEPAAHAPGPKRKDQVE